MVVFTGLFVPTTGVHRCQVGNVRNRPISGYVCPAVNDTKRRAGTWWLLARVLAWGIGIWVLIQLLY